LLEYLKNKKRATEYLQAVLEEYQSNNNAEALLLALRNVTIAQGGFTLLAKKTNLNRESLYKTFFKNDNARIDTLGKLLDGLGFHLHIKAA
jgi:probable addiction module antidote protein